MKTIFQVISEKNSLTAQLNQQLIDLRLLSRNQNLYRFDDSTNSYFLERLGYGVSWYPFNNSYDFFWGNRKNLESADFNVPQLLAAAELEENELITDFTVKNIPISFSPRPLMVVKINGFHSASILRSKHEFLLYSPYTSGGWESLDTNLRPADAEFIINSNDSHAIIEVWTRSSGNRHLIKKFRFERAANPPDYFLMTPISP